jgi:fluoride exporter
MAGASPTLPPMNDRRELGAIFLGGAVGALVRAALVEAVGDGAPAWPWVTFGVNLAGAFALGYFVTRLQERLPLSTYRRPLLGTGLCGALTTFSTMQVELLKMLDAERFGIAAGYLLASVAAGYAGVQLASAMVRRLRLRA